MTKYSTEKQNLGSIFALFKNCLVDIFEVMSLYRRKKGRVAEKWEVGSVTPKEKKKKNKLGQSPRKMLHHILPAVDR